MKYIKEIIMLLLMFVFGAAGYKVMECYCTNQKNVAVQFLDFGGDHSNDDHPSRHSKIYNQGYDQGYKDGQKNCNKDCNCDNK